jgi:uncharacterized protein (TIRG00374 family)
MRLFRQIAVASMKVGAAVALVYWLLKTNKLDLSVLRHLSFDSQTIFLLILASFFILFGFLLVGLRLYWLLHHAQFSIGYFKVFGVIATSLFLGIVLPGLFSGDVMKAAYLCGNVSERKVNALASVIVDRVIGLFSLFLMGTLAILVGGIMDFIPFRSPILLTAPLIVMLIILSSLLLRSDSFFSARLVQLIVSKAPDKFQRFIEALRDFLKSPWLLFKTVALSVINHSLNIGVFIIAAVLIKDTLSPFSHFILDPLALVMNAVPITPGGLGVAESAFAFLYQLAGSSNGALVGLLGRLVMYVLIIACGAAAAMLLRIRSPIPSLGNRV